MNYLWGEQNPQNQEFQALPNSKIVNSLDEIDFKKAEQIDFQDYCTKIDDLEGFLFEVEHRSTNEYTQYSFTFLDPRMLFSMYLNGIEMHEVENKLYNSGAVRLGSLANISNSIRRAGFIIKDCIHHDKHITVGFEKI